MQVRVDIAKGYTVCRPVGPLDAFTAPHLREAMALMTSVPRIVIDLSEVPFIDSAALAALVSGIRRLRETGGRVVVCSTRGPVCRALDLVGFEQVVPVVGTIDDAERIVTARATASVGAVEHMRRQGVCSDYTPVPGARRRSCSTAGERRCRTPT